MSKFFNYTKRKVMSIVSDNRKTSGTSTKVLDRDAADIVAELKAEEMGNLDLIEEEKISIIEDPRFEKWHSQMPTLKMIDNETESSNSKHETYQNLHQQGKLFIDPFFTPKTALEDYKFLEGLDDGDKIYWLRPWQLVKNPKFFDNSNNDGNYYDGNYYDGDDLYKDLRRDICQGQLNDCWLLSTLGNLTCSPEIMHRVIPADKDSNTYNLPHYDGRFYFNFYYFGNWIQVTIDDLLPIIVSPDGSFKYYGCHSESENEFWPALFEKAYAKLQGSYQQLKFGSANQAMMDLTGGAPEEQSIEQLLVKNDDDGDYSTLFENIKTGLANKSLINSSIITEDNTQIEAEIMPGLHFNHAYSVTKCQIEKLKKSDGSYFEQKCISLRNPWGIGSVEWRMDPNYFDSIDTKLNSSWKKFIKISDQEDNDGEFWMPFEIFVKNFTHLNWCRLNMYHYGVEGTWSQIEKHDIWSKQNNTCGGYEGEGICNNPFIAVELAGGEFGDQMVITLQQKIERNDKIMQGRSELGINYKPILLRIYKIVRNEELPIAEIAKLHLSELIKRKKKYILHTTDALQQRDYCISLKNLEKGKYAIVPIALDYDDPESPTPRLIPREDQFFMRVVTEFEA